MLTTRSRPIIDAPGPSARRPVGRDRGVKERRPSAEPVPAQPPVEVLDAAERRACFGRPKWTSSGVRPPYAPWGRSRLCCSAPDASLTDPLTHRTSFEYDARGNRISATDPAGQTTFFRYDAQSRLVETEDAVGNVTRTEYDPEGAVLATADPWGARVRTGCPAIMATGSGADAASDRLGA